MLILNFSHPLTERQMKQIVELAGQSIDEIRQIPTHFNHAQPFEPQVSNLIDSCGLSPHEWQTLPLLIVPPSLNTIALVLIAALHGIMGYFPPIVRIRPVNDAIPPKFEVAEIINLQELRDRFRKKRV